jgi:DNA-binding PadR family transcriptional regulator
MYHDILILSRLVKHPSHGYEIKKHVERILGTGTINNNVLYPALQRFAAQGIIERVAAEADPGRPPRTVYRLTETGHDLLQALLREADEEVLANDAEFQTRVAFFDRIDVQDRVRIIAARRRIVESWISRHERFRAEAEGRPWIIEVLESNLARYRLELAWLDRLEAQARREDDG